MRRPAKALILFVLLLTSCSRGDEPAYTPPAFTETAYALAASDHIAVLDLETNKLDRIKLDREGADLASDGNRVFVLAVDGTVAEIKGKTVGKWTRVTDHGVSMTSMGQNTLIVLGRMDVCLYEPGKGVKKRVALKKPATAITYDPEKNLIWFIDRKRGSAFSLSTEDFSIKKELEYAGNSPHHAIPFPGRQELWVAEGNEFMDGKPYGVGFVKDGPAMAGGINVVDTLSMRQTDFIMVGGNVVDLWLSHDKNKLYAATSQYPEYIEATLSLINPEQRRVKAEFRLCLYCHEENNVDLESGRALVRALAIIDPQTATVSKESR